MLAQPQIQMPKFLAGYPSHHLALDRPKAMPSANYFAGISSIVPAALSPVRSDSPGDNPSDDPTLPSPISPQENTGNFELVSQTALDYPSASNAQPNDYDINSSSGLRDPDAGGHYLSDSPSPVDVQQAPSLSHPSSAPPSQDRFPHILEPPYTGADRTSTDTNSNPERSSRTGEMDKYPGGLVEYRRVSEPTLLTTSSPCNAAIPQRHLSLNLNIGYPSRSTSSMYISPSLHRGSSTGSLRDLRQHHFDYSSPQHEWKNSVDLQRDSPGYLGSHSEEPISPLQSHFGGGMVSPTTGSMYSPVSENFYGPSPPGTGNSASSSSALPKDGPFTSSPPFSKLFAPRGSTTSGSSDADRKNYSFIALPGNTVKKRPRRRYDEIERLYQCSWPDCSKAYGTLNHLNAHVTMQKHGPKRSPSEFKELRKKWRAAKKEAESHMTMGVRRSNFTGHHDDFDYGSRFAFSHTSQRSHSFHPPGIDLPSSLGMNQSAGYSSHPATFSSHHRDEQGIDYDGRRYGDVLTPTWHGNSMSSRCLPETFIVPPHSSHNSLGIADIPRHHSVPVPPSPPRPSHQLSSNSTLLTPLPGYHGHSFISTGHDSIGFNGDGYECYDDSSRPGTGHASIGAPSSDEMQDDRCY